MASIGGFDLGVDLPTISSGGMFWWILLVSGILLLFGIAIFVIWIWYQWKIYNKKIILFENISGQGYQPTWRDRARTVRVGDGGEELLWLKKKRVYITAYGRKMGKNIFWFAVGQDGYWYNTVLGDLDAKMGMLDIEPIDRDMRMMHVAIRKNIQERYRKIKFMEKYGTMIVGGVFLLIMGVFTWLQMDKAGEMLTAAQPVADALISASAELKVAVSHLDNLCSASGISPAGV